MNNSTDIHADRRIRMAMVRFILDNISSIVYQDVNHSTDEFSMLPLVFIVEVIKHRLYHQVGLDAVIEIIELLWETLIQES